MRIKAVLSGLGRGVLFATDKTESLVRGVGHEVRYTWKHHQENREEREQTRQESFHAKKVASGDAHYGVCVSDYFSMDMVLRDGDYHWGSAVDCRLCAGAYEVVGTGIMNAYGHVARDRFVSEVFVINREK